MSGGMTEGFASAAGSFWAKTAKAVLGRADGGGLRGGAGGGDRLHACATRGAANAWTPQWLPVQMLSFPPRSNRPPGA